MVVSSARTLLPRIRKMPHRFEVIWVVPPQPRAKKLHVLLWPHWLPWFRATITVCQPRWSGFRWFPLFRSQVVLVGTGHKGICTGIHGRIFLEPKWLRNIYIYMKNMTSSVGMMKFPIYGKIKNVPNHQPRDKSTCPLGGMTPWYYWLPPSPLWSICLIVSTTRENLRTILLDDVFTPR